MSSPVDSARWFVDSPLEGNGFELPVPRAVEGLSVAIIAGSGCKPSLAYLRLPSVDHPRRATAKSRNRSRIARGTGRFYGAGGEEMATSSLHLIDGVPAMPQPNDLSRSLVALDQNSTIIAVVELSQSSWL